jgi:2-polyprenyl-6-hydroxyphenyl methylase/3-demethylubiquinone-9 3-methyltransferase
MWVVAAAFWPMPWRAGRDVLGIDLATKALKVAQLHALEAQTPNVQYREVSAEALAAEQPGQF